MNRSERKRLIKGTNNKIYNQGRFYKVRYKIIGNNNRIYVDKYSKITHMQIVFHGNNNTIRIGEGCQLEKGLLWLEGNNCSLEIGDRVRVVDANISVAEDNQRIKIGDDCLFSYQVELRTSDSHSVIDKESGKRINFPASIELEPHVWVGARSCILKGVKVGENSIIGANSLVTKDIPANSLAVGSPAKVIKTNVTWNSRQLKE